MEKVTQAAAAKKELARRGNFSFLLSKSIRYVDDFTDKRTLQFLSLWLSRMRAGQFASLGGSLRTPSPVGAC